MNRTWVFRMSMRALTRSVRDSRIIQVLKKQKNKTAKLTTLEGVQSWGPHDGGPGSPAICLCRPGTMQYMSISVNTTRWFARSVSRIVKNSIGRGGSQPTMYAVSPFILKSLPWTFAFLTWFSHGFQVRTRTQDAIMKLGMTLQAQMLSTGIRQSRIEPVRSISHKIGDNFQHKGLTCQISTYTQPKCTDPNASSHPPDLTIPLRFLHTHHIVLLTAPFPGSVCTHACHTLLTISPAGFQPVSESACPGHVVP